MKGSRTGFLRPEPILFVIAALLCASILVVYLQHRALSTLKRQTEMVLQEVSENTATRIATEIRRSFEGPVFTTLTAVNHPLLSAGRLDLVEEHYAKGLDAYPHVDRFFIWEHLTDGVVPGEVIFFGGRPDDPHIEALTGEVKGHSLARFYRDPAMGRVIYDLAQQHVKSQRIYLAAEETFGGARYDVLVRMFWTDANRDRLFALLGYVVNLDKVHASTFAELHRSRLAPLLDDEPKLEMRILNDSGRVVYGGTGPIPPVSARARFRLQFYPSDEIESRMAATVPLRRYSVIVSPALDQGPALAAFSVAQAYWLSGLSVALIVVALVFVVKGNERARQLARMQADFISHASHQLKTPLSLLSAAIETVGMDRVRSPEKLAQYLEIMRTETSRLTVLVERILEFSRVQAQGRRYELESLELVPLVRETVEAFQRGMALEGFDIRVQDTAAAPIVRADPAALEQALVNLLDNAVKYSDEVKQIGVTITETASEARVAVRDRGIGIDPADRHQIFEKFFRGAGAGLNRRGFGLGLAIAKELVAANRGRIDVDSAPGTGSTFTISLPVVGHSQPVGAVVNDPQAKRAASRVV